MPGRIHRLFVGKPWVIDVSIEFPSEKVALQFEKYLKSGSGHAFASRHFKRRLRWRSAVAAKAALTFGIGHQCSSIGGAT
jgi:hypothetical protein